MDNSLKSKGSSIQTCLEAGHYQKLIQELLSEEGLGYGNLPKGLLRFHAYPGENRTPAHEHLVEGLQYGIGKDNTVRIHFTVSPEHESKFKEEVTKIIPELKSASGVEFEVTYSLQKKSTDTIAVTMENEPFEEEDGSLLFRPAGHGALLENLNDIKADLIFIKNIDNVVPDRLKAPTKSYKMAIAGLLLEVQEKVFDAIRGLDSGIDKDSVGIAIQVYNDALGGKIPTQISSGSLEEVGSFLKEKLNRPIRVCGMVKKIQVNPAEDRFGLRKKMVPYLCKSLKRLKLI